jgi:hypothetical protein
LIELARESRVSDTLATERESYPTAPGSCSCCLKM